MLVGKRVTLRGITREDLPALWRFNNDLEIELAGGGDPPIPQAYERLQTEFDRQWSMGGRDGSQFAIEADGKFVGHCGLFNFNVTAHSCELGIGIGDKDYWGKGYGREAIGLLLGYAFRLRNFRRVWLWVHADNERAIRSYLACGFVEEGRLRQHVWSNGRYLDAVYMGILASEWQERGASDDRASG